MKPYFFRHLLTPSIFQYPMQDCRKPRQSGSPRKKNFHHYSEELTP